MATHHYTREDIRAKYVVMQVTENRFSIWRDGACVIPPVLMSRTEAQGSIDRLVETQHGSRRFDRLTTSWTSTRGDC